METEECGGLILFGVRDQWEGGKVKGEGEEG
jgi:hypothetical protein